jgi:uncharacterized membrane protein YbaN (DUF454 family)
VGLFLPGLPTTVFWLAAAWCFARSRPELRDRLYAHPRIGPILSDFLDHGVATRSVKRAAVVGMGLALAAGALLLGPGLELLATALVLSAAAVWVVTRPESAAGR